MSVKISPIPAEIAKRMQAKNVWRVNCPVNLNDLSLLDIEHFNFDGTAQEGQLIVHSKLATRIALIFTELRQAEFPILKMKLIDDYDGDDNLSMADNNSSAFNFRTIAGTNNLSTHSYGLAVDINPIQNPYLTLDQKEGIIQILPKEGTQFINRNNLRAGMIEPVVQIFKNQGLIWGGDWNSLIDYHHFQVPKEELESFLS